MTTIDAAAPIPPDGAARPVDAGFAALLAGDWRTAEGALKTAWTSGQDAAEAQYLLGCLGHRLGRIDVAATLMAQSLQQGLPDGIFARLGTLVAAFGPEHGETLHAFIKLNRLMPRQLAGKMGVVASPTEVEPWHYARGSMSVFPREMAEFEDEARLVERYVLPGHIPEAPPFRRDQRLLTLGSCFAEELRNYLAEQGMRSDWLFVPSGLNNTFALRNFLEWCATGNRSSSAYWYDEHTGGGAVRWEPETEHQAYRAMLERADGLVLTLGLAEVWYDRETGGVFWRGVPRSIFDPARHVCRISTVAENVENLRHILALVRGVRPDLPVVLTLSPVPLKASFTAPSCIVADSVSKSILRVALAEFMAEAPPGVRYWPSFEIVRWLSAHLAHPMFGDDGDTRHVNRPAVKLILDAFIRHYFAAA